MLAEIRRIQTKFFMGEDPRKINSKFSIFPNGFPSIPSLDPELLKGTAHVFTVIMASDKHYSRCLINTKCINECMDSCFYPISFEVSLLSWSKQENDVNYREHPHLSGRVSR